MKVNINILRKVVFTALLISPFCGWSQNYAEDMKRVTEKFQTGDISYHVKYLFYPYDSVKKISDSVSIYSCMSGHDYYSKITSGNKSYEYCRNSKYFFMVDHVESAIAVKKSSDAQQQMWDISKVDSMINIPGVKISYKNLGNSEGEYDIVMKDKMWNRIKMVFSKSDYTLEKISMYSSSKGKMFGASYNKPMIIMYYSGYSNKKLDKNNFGETKFFYETKDGLVLNEAYKKYKLLDYVFKLSGRS